MLEMPRYADTVVVGGGTAGAAVAGRLAHRSDRSVLLVEAGPDYGPFDPQAWPADLLDARQLPTSHGWGYTSAAVNALPNHPLERARVIGGCSSHNGCAAIWGSRADYDGWAALGNPGWAADDLLPFFRQANEMLRVRRPAADEVTPWHQACLEAAATMGLPIVEDLNDLDQDVGMSTSPANIHNGLRWNTAIAYLDPVRTRGQLTVIGDTLVNKLRLSQGRVVAVEVMGPDGAADIECAQVVLCAGAYGSPAILLRSGVGPADELRASGVEPIQNLPGVGRNLHDHPAMYLKFSGAPELIAALQAFERRGGVLMAEQTIAKLRSPFCQSAFDLHLFPVGGPFLDANSSGEAWEFVLPVANMTPQSRGGLRLRSNDPSTAPLIDTGYLTDPEDADLTLLVSGVEIARQFARQSPLAEWIGDEIPPTADCHDRESIRRNCAHYFHPVGTCKMGPASDPAAVVDSRGKVQGWENLYVADASIMPVIPRANTNLPALVMGERIAGWLLDK
jgi:choline dehydrogenase